MDLQALNQMLHPGGIGQHRGHHHHRVALGRDAGGIIQPWQQARPHQSRGQQVHQGHRRLAGAEQEDQGEQPAFPVGNSQLPDLAPDAGRGGQAEPRDAPRVERQGKSMNSPFHQRPARPAHLHLPPQAGLALVHQVITHMAGPLPAPVVPWAFPGQFDGGPGDLGFRAAAVPGKEFHRMPVPIPRRKVHVGVNPRRIRHQHRLHQTQRFHKLLPVDGAEQSQTGDAVADGHLVRRLSLTFLLDQQFDRQALFHQAVFQPTAREMQHGTLPRQTLAEFRHKRTREREFRFRHVGHDDHQMGGLLFGHGLQTVHPLVGQIPFLPRHRQPRGDALQVFNQPQPQHDRDGPQLPQFQGGHRLISRDKGAQRPDVDLRIHMRNQFEHQVVNARQPGGRPLHQPRQLPAVITRQMSSRQVNLLLDQVEVVQQPFRGRRDPPGGVHRHRGQIEAPQQDFVLAQLRQQPVRPQPRDRRLVGGQRQRMLRELFDTEQLRPQRRLDLVRARPSIADHPVLKSQSQNLHCVVAVPAARWIGAGQPVSGSSIPDQSKSRAHPCPPAHPPRRLRQSILHSMLSALPGRYGGESPRPTPSPAAAGGEGRGGEACSTSPLVPAASDSPVAPHRALRTTSRAPKVRNSSAQDEIPLPLT